MSTPAQALETIARRLVDAFNRRDAEDLVALTDPDVEWHPSLLAGPRRAYRGHDELREWMLDLCRSPIEPQARVLEVEAVGRDRFLLLSEVLIDGQPVSPSALLGRVNAERKIVEAHAYLTDEEMLTQVGIVDGAEHDPAFGSGAEPGGETGVKPRSPARSSAGRPSA